MRVAALYDIHGNLPALDAVLAEIATLGCDRIVIGGDVALGPMPRETLARLDGLGERVGWIRGNCDREMGAALERPPDPAKPWEARLRWAAGCLTPAQCQRLAGLPLRITLDIGGLGPVLFCHATPRSDEEVVTRLSPEARLAETLAGIPERVVISGHTHVQFDREVQGRRWINAGSVGMPYQGRTGAYWVMLGPGVDLRRTAYDADAAARRIEASGFPDAERFARQELLAPITAAAASERFEQMSVQARAKSSA